MKAIVRSAKKSDLSSLEDLYTQCMGEFEYTFYKTNFRSYISSHRDLIKVSEEPSGIISGFVLVYISNPQKARIQAMFVSANYRNRGNGTKLLGAIEKEILTNYPKLRYLSIRIPEEYFLFQSFFLNQNFEIIAKINGYVKNNLDFPYSVNKNFFIRNARESDLEGILRIEKACFSTYWQMSKVKFQQIMKNPSEVLFVAFWEGKIVGYNFNAVSQINQSGNYIRIATLPDLQQKRIATSLTAHAFKWFRAHKIDRIVLSTYANSPVHNNMYKKWGFIKNDQEVILARKYY